MTPNVNLVTNVGFRPDAYSHDSSEAVCERLSRDRSGPIVHPDVVQVDLEADRFTFDNHFGGYLLRSRRRPLGFIRWFVPGVLRVARRKLESLRHR